jgi:hypothetical protein
MKQPPKAVVTVIVNGHVEVLPDESVTEYVTVVTPTGKNEPDAGAAVGVPRPEQLSETTASGKVTIAPGVVPCTDDATVVMLGGHAIDGACVSLTVTVNELDGPAVDEQVTADPLGLGDDEADAAVDKRAMDQARALGTARAVYAIDAGVAHSQDLQLDF